MNTILLILYILMFVAFVICNAIGINLPIKNAKNKTKNRIDLTKQTVFTIDSEKAKEQKREIDKRLKSY